MMKNILFAGLLLYFSSSHTLAGHYTIITSPYPPFIKEDGSGYIQLAVTEAFVASGDTVTYAYYPRKRSVHEFKKQPNALNISTASNLRGISFESISIGQYARTLYYLPSSQLDQGNVLYNLKGKQIAVHSGSSSISKFLERGISVITVNSHDSLFKMLISGRISAFYLPYESYVLYANKYQADHPEQRIVPYHFDINAISLIKHANGNHPGLLARFKNGLTSMINSGRYQEILQDSYQGALPDYTSMGDVGILSFCDDSNACVQSQ